MRIRRDARFILWCCVFWAVVMAAALPLGKLAQMFGLTELELQDDGGAREAPPAAFQVRVFDPD